MEAMSPKLHSNDTSLEISRGMNPVLVFPVMCSNYYEDLSLLIRLLPRHILSYLYSIQQRRKWRKYNIVVLP